MKPIRVCFEGFGPYVKRQDIDFDQLSGSGLFLICGETGSGKTTILDAMCCALYGSCSGEIRGDMEAMRCRQAGPENPTVVEFIFETGRRKYRFLRRMVPRKSRKADTKVTYNETLGCDAEEDGRWSPLFDNCRKRDMTEKAEELIGLNLDQFRQVIILPQGRFETLLTSNSGDKENILSSIFHTGKWGKVVDRMNDGLNERSRGLDQQKREIDILLKQLQLASMEDLPEAEKAAAQKAAEAAEAEKRAEQARKEARVLLDLDRDFQELKSRQQKLNTARENEKNDEQLRIRLHMAAKAEKARKPHDEWETAKQEQLHAEKRLKEAAEEKEQAAAAKQKAETEKTAHEARKSEQDQRTNEKIRLDGLREIYQNIDGLEKTAAREAKALETARRKKGEAEKTLSAETEKLRQLETAWSEADDAYKVVAAAYRASAAGNLAADLRDGEPCPVCGSVHHPRPAVLPEGAVGSQEVDAAEERVRRARKAFENRRTVREEADRAQREAEHDFTEAEKAFSLADQKLRQAQEQRVPELKTLRDLDSRRKKLGEEIQAWEAETDRLTKAYNQADVSLGTRIKTLEERTEQARTAGETLREKEAAWLKALEATELGTEVQYNAMILSVEEQTRLSQILAGHKKALEIAKSDLLEQQQKLEGKECPEPGTAQTLFGEAERAYTEAVQNSTLAGQNRKQLAETAGKLRALNAGIADRQRKYEEDSEFVKVLRGSNGISIQRYVLSVRLDQVIREANRLLSGIYGGRYRLHRSDESHGSSHKKGLELEVYDSMNDQQRSVCTLSGGEKFLVALSLAIGLCTVVRNEQKGVSLDAMFVDEGFGSLDRNSLGDALDILQTVRSGHGLVGIISHIQLLEETIPTKILTQKTPEGSKATVILG